MKVNRPPEGRGGLSGYRPNKVAPILKSKSPFHQDGATAPVLPNGLDNQPARLPRRSSGSGFEDLIH